MDDFEHIIENAFPEYGNLVERTFTEHAAIGREIGDFPEHFSNGMRVLQWAARHKDWKTRITAYQMLYQLRDIIDSVIEGGV